MKFSQALKANSVPDWRHHYVHYSRLKKMIFRLEQLQNNNGSLTPVPEHRQSLDFSNHGSTAPLLDRRSPSMLQRASSGFDNSHVDELMFEREIHEELARVKAFYVEKVCGCKCSVKLSAIALHLCLWESISVQTRVMTLSCLTEIMHVQMSMLTVLLLKKHTWHCSHAVSLTSGPLVPTLMPCSMTSLMKRCHK